MEDIIIEDCYMSFWLCMTLCSALYFAVIVLQIILLTAKNDFGLWYDLATRTV